MWIIFALLGAIGKSYSGYFRKKIAANVSSEMYIWISHSLVLLILTPIVVFQIDEVINSIIKLPLIVIGIAISYIIALKFNFEALKREDLSYVAPLNAFVPVFTLIIGWMTLNETPPKSGLVGILIIVLGAYVISIKPDKISWYAPLKRMLTSAGAQLSLCVAFFYAVNTVLLKEMSNSGYGVVVITYVTTLAGWVMLIHVPIMKRNELRGISKSDKIAVLGGGLSSFAGSFFHILAVANTYASYAVAVRRSDSIISVILGWRFLKESNIKIKLAGSLIITLGAVVLTLAR